MNGDRPTGRLQTHHVHRSALKREISDKNADISRFVRLVLEDEEIRDAVIGLTTTDRDIMTYYHGYYILDGATSKKPGPFYGYWEKFEALVDHPNSYHRDIGLTLLANLVPVDAERRFERIFDSYFSHLCDVKFMTGCCCVRNAVKIIEADTRYAERIVDLLLSHRARTGYPEKQEALFECDILDALRAAYGAYPDRERILAFVRNAESSASTKTRKRAKELLAILNGTEGTA